MQLNVSVQFPLMGERDLQKRLWSYQVNLDKRVRSDQSPRRTQLFGQQTDLTRPRWHLLHPTLARETPV
jgi:hypothetical protein